MSRSVRTLMLAAAAVVMPIAGAHAAQNPVPVAAAAKARTAVTVVLVHGAWADGSSWEKVIPLL